MQQIVLHQKLEGAGQVAGTDSQLKLAFTTPVFETKLGLFDN
jgi:hypothetical protein